MGLALEPVMALALLFAPLFGLVALAAVLSPFLVGGLHPSAMGLHMKWERLNPAAGLARMFSTHSLMELLKALLKAVLIGGVAAYLGAASFQSAQALSLSDLHLAMGQQAEMLRWVFGITVLAMALVALVDAPYQLFQYTQKLRMTKQQVKEEMKETEGNPEIKAKIRAQQRAMARGRMMSKVPTADVVVTNPTHYAVALKYDGAGAARAPKVVAKGVDAVAARIKELAAESQVPMLEAPPLARALHKHVELDAEIPAELYNATAQVLAYVYALKAGGPRAAMLRMPTAESLAVPEGMDPLVAGQGRHDDGVPA